MLCVVRLVSYPLKDSERERETAEPTVEWDVAKESCVYFKLEFTLTAASTALSLKLLGLARPS